MIRGRRQCDPINGCGKFYHQHLDECPSCGAPNWASNFIPFNPLDWIYDLETYPNIITAAFKHPLTGTRAFFEYSFRCNQLRELVVFLHALIFAGSRLVGFNNLGFDYPIIHYILQFFNQGLSVEDIYRRAQAIIDTPWERRFDNLIWDSDVYIQQIDLFKIHHFDNTARSTSLKILEFNMQSQNIEDLPFEPGRPLTAIEADRLVKYNDHDVDETEKFYIESLEMIEFREQLGSQHNCNFLNHSDKKIGTTLFIDALEKSAPGTCFMHVNGKKVPRQTIRPNIRIADVIFPYINFKRPEFQRVKSWLCSQVITQTKGVFEYLEVSPVMAMSMNYAIIKVYGLTEADVPSITPGKVLDRMLKHTGVLLSKCREDLIHRQDLDKFKFVSGWKDQSGLNTIVEDFRYDFGTGGIHGSIDSTIVYSDHDYVIYDWDVGAYYPSIGGANKIYPEHLSEQFIAVDEMLKEERSKHKKGTPINKAIKLARNGAYGDSNNRYSPFFDPQYTMAITINGQLLLCMLAERLIDIPGLQMIQINTDGLTVRCPRGYVDHMKTICKWWEDFTCLTLESAIYSRMFIRDVNNYIAEYKNGDIKRKGAYEYELEWHQNHSQKVVAKAAESYLLHGTDITHFIYNHLDIFDFMLRSKVKRADKLVLVDPAGNEQRLQNITRYYIANHGGSLIKISPPAKGNIPGAWKRSNKLTDHFYFGVLTELKDCYLGEPISFLSEELDSTGLPWDERINTKNRSKYEIVRTGFNVGFLVAPCNDIRDANRSNINFEYYIAEAHKLVDPLIRS